MLVDSFLLGGSTAHGHVDTSITGHSRRRRTGFVDDEDRDKSFDQILGRTLIWEALQITARTVDSIWLRVCVSNDIPETIEGILTPRFSSLQQIDRLIR